MSSNVINPYAFTGGGGGTPTIIAHVGAGGSINGVTTPSINTTGANFIVVNCSWYYGVTANGTLSDDIGGGHNTWIPLTARASGLTNKSQLFYCYAPTVGSGHTFTYSGTQVYPSVQVIAWNNIASSPADQENGNTGSGTTITTNNITPGQANTVVIAGCGFDGNIAGTTSIDGVGWQITDTSNYVAGISEGGSIAYLILTSSIAQNRTWTFSATTAACTATIASFKY